MKTKFSEKKKNKKLKIISSTYFNALTKICMMI